MSKIVMLANPDGDLGLGEMPMEKAKAEAQSLANLEGRPITLRHPISDKVLATVKPKAPKKAKATAPKTAPKAAEPAVAPKAPHEPAKPKAVKAAPKAKPEAAPKAVKAKPEPVKAKPAKAKANEPAKPKAPKGRVAEILKLASRPKGASPAELNELTSWKGAPWKWLFANPKGNGYCDRWGYKLAVLQTDQGVRYHVSKI